MIGYLLILFGLIALLISDTVESKADRLARYFEIETVIDGKDFKLSLVDEGNETNSGKKYYTVVYKEK